ncbi:MAG: aldehyde dehydrogenase family protein [Spirochaetes bacterium]|nr:aldehyde dehydrogenase family protein [Spirochaetota bacterium]
MASDNEFYSYSPINGEKIGTYKNMNKEEIEGLIEKAQSVKNEWIRLLISERLVYIKKMIRVIAKNADYYAELIHKDNGKSKIESLTTEIITVLSVLKYYVKNAKKILKTKKINTPFYLVGKKGYIVYESIGVIGIIAPWNYPLNLSFIPAISAIIAGNTVVLKPSSQTPCTGVIIEDIIKKSSLPDGVLNIAWGKGIAGQYIAEGDIQKLFFTGSTGIGKKLAKICTDKLIPIELELGGKDPAIILEGANLKRAARGVTWGSLINSGQSCTSIERVYVTEKDYDLFIGYLKDLIKQIKMSEYEDADIGAMTTSSQVDIVKKQLDDAVKKGANIIYGGTIKENFFEPTIVGLCNHNMELIKEETFGPIIACIKTKNDEESLQLANDSKYGLCSSIYGDSKKAKQYALNLQAGGVNINNSLLSFVTPGLPFGGVKESGIGRYHGKEGLYTFCNIKSILIDNFAFFPADFIWAPYGKNAYKKHLNFINKYWGSISPLRFLSGLPLLFKKK